MLGWVVHSSLGDCIGQDFYRQNALTLTELTLSSFQWPFFSRRTWVSRFIGAKDDGSGGDNWSYKSCEDPVKSSPPTNQHQMPFLSPIQHSLF